MKTLSVKLLSLGLLLVLLFAQCNNPFYSKEDYMQEFDELAQYVTTEYEQIGPKELKRVKHKLERLAHEDYERFRPEMTIWEKGSVKKDQWTVQAFVTGYEIAEYMDSGTETASKKSPNDEVEIEWSPLFGATIFRLLTLLGKQS